MGPDLLTPAEVARVLSASGPTITPFGVRWLIREGKLKARRYGSSWVIRRADLEKFQRQPRGRPKTTTD